MYNKTTWKTGDTITADKMNNIEGGIKTNETTSTQHIQDKNNPHGVTAEQIKAVSVDKLGIADGVATLGDDGKIPKEQLPDAQIGDFIPSSEKGTANGVATLDESGKVPSEQLPETQTGDFIPNSEKGVAGGVATLDILGKIPSEQLPDTSVSIKVGTVTSGETASVTNSGTAQNAVFDFVIPKGEKGEQGMQGEKGDKGDNATINGVNTLTIEQGENITIKQEDNVLTISSTGGGATYQSGNGIDISGETISTKISQNEDNATGILNGEIYTPIAKLTNLYPLVNVSVLPIASGITVKATKGISEITGITDENGKVSLNLNSLGVWTISVTIKEDTVEGNIAIGEIKEYSISLSTINVFGVAWDTTNPSTQLIRLTPETDPYNVVTQTVTQEPIPALGTGSGSSPFDDFMPWKGMEEYNIIDGVVSYKKGEPNFSRSLYDTMVYIPPFYYRREEQNNIQYFYVGSEMFEGAELHPGSGKYIGKYLSSTDAVSKSGLLPQGNMSLQTALTTCSAKGENYSVYGYPTYCAIVLLYLIEFANLNSQQMIGNDIVGGSLQNTGQTDVMIYHTGNTNTGKFISSVQYRGIENPYGNILQILGGVFFDDSLNINICVEPNLFQDSITIDYKNTGMVGTLTGATLYYGEKILYSQEYSWCIAIDGTNGSSNTYSTDGYFSNTNSLFMVGGTCVMVTEGNSPYSAGFFYHNGYWGASAYNAIFGYRLQFNP